MSRRAIEWSAPDDDQEDARQERDTQRQAQNARFHLNPGDPDYVDPPEPAPDPLTALRNLHQVCVAMDAENDGEKPTEQAYLKAMADAEAAIEGA